MTSSRSILKVQHQLYHYVAVVTRVYDGDTITVNMDLGLGIWRHDQVVRLWKIDTPELRGPERDEGLQVRDYLRNLILGKTILLRSILDKRGDDSTGKFGRLLGEVLLEDDAGALINVNQLLLEQGFAIPYGLDAMPPLPSGLPHPLNVPLSTVIVCPFCGALRPRSATGLIADCSNCLDGSL